MKAPLRSSVPPRAESNRRGPRGAQWTCKFVRYTVRIGRAKQNRAGKALVVNESCAVTFGFVVDLKGPVAGLKVNECLGEVLFWWRNAHAFQGQWGYPAGGVSFRGTSFCYLVVIGTTIISLWVRLKKFHSNIDYGRCSALVVVVNTFISGSI